MSKVKERKACDKCRDEGHDNAGDNLIVYDDGGQHCYRCGYHVFPDGDVKPDTDTRDVVQDWVPLTGEYAGLPHRKIHEDICRLYRYQTTSRREKDIEIANYYDHEGHLKGQKIRVGKQFACKGDMTNAGFFGQQLWRHGGKRIIITEGEIDCLVVAQFLNGKWPVVSLPNGAGSGKGVVKKELQFLSSYDEVIFCLDMDDEGRHATIECAKLLPPGKSRIVTLPRKDAGEMLMNNEMAVLSTAIWEAKVYRPDGVIHASEVDSKSGKDLTIFPYPWHNFNRKLYGQRKGEICMYTSGTGMGKSTLLRAIAFDHLKRGRTVGMIMLEESPMETMYEMMSLLIGQPVRRIMAARCLNAALKAQGVEEIDFGIADTLEDKDLEQGTDWLADRNLYLYDHLGENLDEELLSKIEYMVVGLGCDVVMLDHISAVVAATGNGGSERRDIDRIMSDLRSLVSRTNVRVDCVTQLRKNDGKPYEEGGRITLHDLRGSGSLASVPNSVVAIERNQQDNDAVRANTMVVRSLKDRFSGYTGIVAALVYDNQTNSLQEVDYMVDGDGDLHFSTDLMTPLDEKEIPA